VSALRALAALAFVVLLLAAPALGQSTAREELLPDLEDEVMCVVCGTTLGLASGPQAESERDFVRDLIRSGLTKDEIKDQLVAEYGPDVLATPEASGFDLTAWVVPAIALIAVGAGIVVGARRWRRSGAGSASAEPAPINEEGDEERLQADLSRYEL
jgi:cytochrome c-type biogenesis protein CcmH